MYRLDSLDEFIKDINAIKKKEKKSKTEKQIFILKKVKKKKGK
jgi:hypothetical protein